MNITITGRHFDVSESLQAYSEKKIKKLETYFHQLIDARVILYIEKLDHGAEVIINGDGIQFHGREKAADMYSAVDLLFEKMEKQIIKYKEKHSSHKAVNIDKVQSFDMTSDEGREIILNQVSNKPIDSIEAYLQMKIDDRDFILFKKGDKDYKNGVDYLNKSYAVICKDSSKIRMMEVPFEKMRNRGNGNGSDIFAEYELNVIDDSPAKPDIEFKETVTSSIREYTFDEALKEFESTKIPYLPFFNVESQYFNVIYRNGNAFEVMVPTF